MLVQLIENIVLIEKKLFELLRETRSMLVGVLEAECLRATLTFEYTVSSFVQTCHTERFRNEVRFRALIFTRHVV